jgi:predicted GIY-YIG superfamily endonuclease
MTKGNTHLFIRSQVSGPVVYMVTNLITGERYIGCTSDLRKRLNQHESSARKGKTTHRHLAEAMAKLGCDLFRASVLKQCESIDDAYVEEERLVVTLRPEYNGQRGGRRRAVRCLSDGKTFKSASAAARFYGVARSALIEHCLGKNGRQHVAYMQFEYVGDSAIDQIEAKKKWKKLTPDEVQELRALKPSHSIAALMKRFGVGRDAVIDAASGHSWKWIN